MVAYSGPSESQGGVIARPEAVAYTPEVWIPSVIRYRQRAFSMANYVTMMSFEGKKGDLLRKPYIGRLRSRKKLPGAPYQFETRTEGEFKMVVDRHTYAGFSVDMKMDMFTEIDIAQQYTPEMGQALTEEIEYSLLGERATLLSYDPTNNHTTSGSPLDVNDIYVGVETFLKRNIPLNETYLFVGPEQYISLFSNNPELTTMYGTDGTNAGDVADIKSGQIVGNFMGVRIVLNQNIRDNSTTGISLGGTDYPDNLPGGVGDGELVATPGMSGSPFNPTQYGSDKYPITLDDFLPANAQTAIMLHQSCIGLAMPLAPKLEIWWEPNYGETRYKTEQIYDIKVIDPTAGFLISTDESGNYTP